MDAVQLGRCVDSKATDAEVTRTQEMGRALGVDGTPTLYLNGRKLMDQMAQWSTLQQLIALEMDQQAKDKEAEKCCVVEIPKIASSKVREAGCCWHCALPLRRAGIRSRAD